MLRSGSAQYVSGDQCNMGTIHGLKKSLVLLFYLCVSFTAENGYGEMYSFHRGRFQMEDLK